MPRCKKIYAIIIFLRHIYTQVPVRAVIPTPPPPRVTTYEGDKRSTESRPPESLRAWLGGEKGLSGGEDMQKDLKDLKDLSAEGMWP